MALETVNPPPAPPTTHTAQLVGQVFVEQYYQILHNSPEHLFKFYQDSSVFCRPGPDGSMISVRTMQGINDKVLSLDSKHITAEIENVDSHDSFMGGVTVFVTGYLTGKDDVRKEFVQSFFLAPQEKGYFVQNDIFRYVGGSLLVGANNHLPTNGSSEDTQLEPSQGVDHQVVESATPPPEDEVDEGPEVCEPLENGTGAHSPVVQVIQEDPAPVVRSIPSSVKEDAQKKTYASIVKVMKDNKSPPPIVKAAPVHVPTTAVKASSPVKNAVQQVVAVTTPVPPPETSALDSTNVPETCNTPEVEGHSVYVRNLPLNITASQLELEFKKFGAIRPGGVQVRSNKQEPPYCFGFVEFESLSSMQAAIEASPVMVGDRKVQVEVKRTTSRVGGYGPRSRFIQPGRTGGGYRNDSFRGGRRGGYGAGGGGGGGRGYSRGEYGNHRGEFSGRPRANYQNMGSFGNSNRAVRAVESNRVATVSA